MPLTLKIAVRTLVEQVLHSGDLVMVFAGPSRHLEGIRGHQKVRQSRPAGYIGEVPVSLCHEAGDIVLEIGGRIDGLFETAEGWVVDEIKTTGRDPLDPGFAADPLHWAQARIYAHMLARSRNLEQVGVQLTYYQRGSGRIHEICHWFGRDELAAFFDAVVAGYLRWAAMARAWQKRRDRTIADLAFPFGAFRPGQRAMAAAVYKAIQGGTQLLVEAPTGIGKTMAALFPAIKALGKGLCTQIFYLTARTTGQAAAEAALARLAGAGLNLRSLTLTAKDKICFDPPAACHPDACAFARGHYDRLDPALSAALAIDQLTRAVVEDLARCHRLCPFAFALALVPWADVVIGDCNYAFDPGARLRHLAPDEGGTGAVLLIDEAHNLVDRSREMFSATLEKAPFLDLRRRAKAHAGLYRSCGKINAAFVRLRRHCVQAGGQMAAARLPEELIGVLQGFVHLAERLLTADSLSDPALRQLLLERYGEAADFVRVADQFNDAYRLCAYQNGRDVTVKLFCLDPSALMGQALAQAKAAILYSATLSPAGYFKTVIGCNPAAGHLCLPSPFGRDHLGVFVAGDIATTYGRREHTRPAVAAAIAAAVTARPGNYLVFFPSYDYLNLVGPTLDRLLAGVNLLVQTPAMTDDQRLAFLARFQSDNPGTLVGLAVMGGIFGEGIDLVGERLVGAVIVGVGLPPPNLERELIRDHFAGRQADGFAVAYTYPGINRVLQAAGRVIRSDTDCGVVVLIDRRYASHRYRCLLPAHWRPVGVAPAADLAERVGRFWQSVGPPWQAGDFSLCEQRADGLAPATKEPVGQGKDSR